MLVKVKRVSKPVPYQVFRRLLLWSDYADNIQTGRYRVGSEGALQTYRHIHNEAQASETLTLKSVRTKADLAREVSRVLMFTSAELLDSLNDPKVCKHYGYTPETVVGMFIPNSYDLYWDISVSDFLKRMDKESKRFWNEDRMKKAQDMGLSQNEVITLASIVDEETNDESEMPKVAGMYINRLNDGMRLQADPTVKFATGNFKAKRIYKEMLSADSPPQRTSTGPDSHPLRGSYRRRARLCAPRLYIYVCQARLQWVPQFCQDLRGAPAQCEGLCRCA